MGWVTEHHPSPEGLASCVQCGLCLPACPTFRLTGRETASPRGRLQAMRAVQNGDAVVDAKFAEILDFCLGCRACEPVCPGMVPYGSLLEGARAEIVAQRPSRSTPIRKLVLGRLLPSRFFLRMATFALLLMQRARLTALLPSRLRRSARGLRPGLGRSLLGQRPETGEVGSVGLLVGCVQEQWFGDVNTAAIKLLQMAGISVYAPERQTCCGALAAHDGHADEARRLARTNRDAFRDADRVVATAAGCSAHLRDIDPDRSSDITVLVSELIDSGKLPVVAADNGPVVVQDPCHLRHAQRVIAEPRKILQAAGFTLVELDDGALCCGAAGLYAVLEPEASQTLGEKKASLVRSTGERLVASANPGCEIQLRSQLGPGFRIAHPIELYLEAIEKCKATTNVSAVEMGT